ncbi:MAG TPA: RDD family protein [Candidatus Dormibacteraeota bacterium]|nr:RDD family protein [Candidatus Dormibacteraeota bacterium]
MWRTPPVRLEDRVRAPVPPPPDRLRDAFFDRVSGLTLGAVRAERWRLRLGPLTLLAFDEPAFDGAGWAWPIAGGLLARSPGGVLRFGWRDGLLVGAVDGYRPSLPRPLYRLTQAHVHRLVTRRFLLLLRGRTPAPGVPAGPAPRLVAAAVDVVLCAAATAALRPRRRLLAFGVLAAAYHVACWSMAGRTAGGLVVGQRLVSVDGSRVTLGQALVRLVALPLAARTGRAMHDEAAGTEVVDSSTFVSRPG